MKEYNLYLIALTPFVCFFLGYLSLALVVGNKTYNTPQLTGLQIYQATQLISKNNISLRIVNQKEHLDLPAGTILSQKPAPGSSIKAHQTIFVITSQQPPAIIAPNFLQQSIDTIQNSCKKLNLKCKTYPITAPAATSSCIGQIPTAQQEVKNKKITLYLAQNKPQIYLMPNFTGQTLTQVQEFLQNFPVKVITQRHYQNRKTTKSIVVTEQKPLAGSLVTPNEQLTIYLETT